MADGNFLTKKAGPFPVWGWAILGIAVLVGGYMLLKNGSSSSTSTIPLTGTDSDAGSSSTGTDYGYDTSSDSTLSDNSSWLSEALSVVGATTENSQALQNYLNGGTNTAAQDALVNKALGALGAPPEGTQGQYTVTSTTAGTPKLNTYGAFVENLYNTILGRTVSGNALGSTAEINAANESSWATDIASGKMTEAQVAKAIGNSAEAKQKAAPGAKTNQGLGG